ASRHLAANVRVTGTDTPIVVAVTTAPAHFSRRFRTAARRDSTDPICADAAGCQLCSGVSTAIRSSTQGSFTAITPHILRSKRPLGATDERADRGRVQPQRRGQVVVGQTIASKNQQGCISPPQCREHQAYPLLFVLYRVQLFRRRRRPSEGADDALEPAAPRGPAQFIDRQPYRHAIEPADRPLTPRVPVPPPLDERIHREVLSAAAIAHDAADDTGHAREVRREYCVKIECVFRRGFSRHGVAVRVHTSITSGGARL